MASSLFPTKWISAAPEIIAADGSEVRILCELPRGAMEPLVFDAQIALGFAPDLFQDGPYIAFRLNLEAVAEI